MSKKKAKRGIVSSIPRSMEIATDLAVTTGGTSMSAYSTGDVLMASTARPADKVADADLALLITHQSTPARSISHPSSLSLRSPRTSEALLQETH